MAIQLSEGIGLLSGGMFDYSNPGKSSINIEDIARPLANNCRFAGHLPWHYSIAQHCVNVSRLVPDDLAFTGLMHDTSEAFTNDITTPLKQRSDEHTSELPSLMRISYAVFCLKKK